MTRKELEELGYTKEQIDQLMDLNGKAIEKVKSERDDAINQLTVTKEELAKREQDFNELKENSSASDELKSKLEELTTQYEDFQEQAKQREQELKLEKELDLAIAKSGTIDDVSLRANLDLSKVELTDEGIKGLDEQINTLKESKSFLFNKGLDGGMKHGTPAKVEPTLQEDIAKKVYNKN